MVVKLGALQYENIKSVFQLKTKTVIFKFVISEKIRTELSF